MITSQGADLSAVGNALSGPVCPFGEKNVAPMGIFGTLPALHLPPTPHLQPQMLTFSTPQKQLHVNTSNRT